MKTNIELIYQNKKILAFNYNELKKFFKEDFDLSELDNFFDTIINNTTSKINWGNYKIEIDYIPVFNLSNIDLIKIVEIENINENSYVPDELKFSREKTDFETKEEDNKEEVKFKLPEDNKEEVKFKLPEENKEEVKFKLPEDNKEEVKFKLPEDNKEEVKFKLPEENKEEVKFKLPEENKEEVKFKLPEENKEEVGEKEITEIDFNLSSELKTSDKSNTNEIEEKEKKGTLNLNIQNIKDNKKKIQIKFEEENKEISKKEILKTIESNLNDAMNEMGLEDKEELYELFNGLLELIEENKEDFYKALKRNDYEKLHRIAHTLKGASLSLRISFFAELLKQIDELSRKKENISIIEDKINRFYKIYYNIKKYYVKG